MKKFLLSIVAVVLLTASYAQFTRQEAIDLVLNDLVADDIGKVDVFSKITSHSGGDSLILMHGEKIKASYENNWVFFVDDHIYSDWFHDCRFIFVNTLNGEHTIVNQQIYTQDFKTNYENVELAPRYEPEYQTNSIDYSPTQLEPNLHSYAMIVCVEDEQKYWNSVSLIYLTLLEQGYTKENIFVHYNWNGTSSYGSDLDGDGNFDDIDFPATLHDFALSMENLSAINGNHPNHPVPQLEEEDQFAMFFVGVPTSYECGFGECLYFWSTDGQSYASFAGVSLGSVLGTIRAIQQNILLAVNYGGLFFDHLTDPYSFQLLDNRHIHTPSGDPYSTTHDEIWITGGRYNEYIFYWAAAMRGVYPYPYLKPWSVFAITGQFPFDQFFDDHPEDYDPNTDSDAYVQMDEAFLYADNQNTWSYDAYYFNPYDVGENENPQEWDSFPFEESLITLAGLAGKIYNTQSIEGRKYLIGGNLDIMNGTLTLEEDTELFFGNELANLTVKDNTAIIIEDNVSFYGNDLNHINIDGIIEIGKNVSFSKGDNSGNFSGLYLNHHLLNTTLSYALFTNSGLHNSGENLTITNSTFTDCGTIYSYRGNVSVSEECNFTNTWFYLENTEQNENFVTVSNSSFNSSGGMVAIDIWNYNNYHISNNTIDAYINGIQIVNSGYGKVKKQMIADNTITNCIQNGIYIYGTNGDIYRNHIYNNNKGISLVNHSNIRLYGNPDAVISSQTQQIMNNDSYEVFTTKHSFPKKFHHNVIIDDDNDGGQQDALVYNVNGIGILKDARYNCWEDIEGSFNPLEDLYDNGYIWEPSWCPVFGGGTSTDSDEAMYNTANTQFDDEDYTGAKATYQQLIEQYPESKYAKAGIQELFAGVVVELKHRC